MAAEIGGRGPRGRKPRPISGHGGRLPARGQPIVGIGEGLPARTRTILSLSPENQAYRAWPASEAAGAGMTNRRGRRHGGRHRGKARSSAARWPHTSGLIEIGRRGRCPRLGLRRSPPAGACGRAASAECNHQQTGRRRALAACGESKPGTGGLTELTPHMVNKTSPGRRAPRAKGISPLTQQRPRQGRPARALPMREPAADRSAGGQTPVPIAQLTPVAAEPAINPSGSLARYC